MGASGSGKTTLLNCISTIDRVTSGHIYVAGEDITKLKGNNFGTVFINLLGKPNINSWRGRTTPQILINDYEIVGNKYSF